ncbi:MAG: MBL fold metallo-hydrolase [Promethearchaeota archaeon]|nr:MAG: MBL fold metallo-hydrolase [Candidatus Lokiarchaeota archaeon]
MKSKFKYIQVGFTTCYLLDCNEGYLLIDVGYPSDYEDFVKKLKDKYGIQISQLKYLLLTHHHDDHAGFGAEFLEKSGAKLILHENALEQLKLGASEDEGKPLNRRIKFIMNVFEQFHEFKFPAIEPSNGDIILKGSADHAEVLRNIGIEGTIIHTPGHTRDGISIVLSDGSIFPGDNAMNAWFFNILGIKKRPIYIQDINLILDSWQRYIDLGGKLIYPAHGKPFHIKYLEKNLKKFREM